MREAMTIRTRIEQLEAKSAAQQSGPDLWIRSVSPDPAKNEGGVVKIRQWGGCGNREWLRKDGETEEEFFERVKAEAPPAVPPNLRGFVCFHRGEDD